MSTAFEIAKAMIDHLIQTSARPVSVLDAETSLHCDRLHDAYANGALNDSSLSPIDYGGESCVIAYTYTSLPAHADWVYRALSLAGCEFRRKRAGYSDAKRATISTLKWATVPT